MCFVGGVVGVGTNSHRGVDRYSVNTSSKRPPKGLYSARIQYSDRIPHGIFQKAEYVFQTRRPHKMDVFRILSFSSFGVSVLGPHCCLPL